MMIRTPLLSLGLFVFFSFAYVWASPSLAYQHWDSLEYARNCELYGPRVMLGNHPLGHLAECGVFALARRLGYTGRALPVLQICNGITGAAAVAVFLVLLTTVLSVQRVRAVGWSVTLGAAYGCGYYAGTANIYSISMLFLVLAWVSSVRHLTQPSHEINSVPGVLVGIATLTHQFNGVLLATGVIGLLPFVRRREWRSLTLALSIGLSGAVVTTAVGYALLGALRFGSWSPADIIAWVIGYGAHPAYGRFLTVASVKSAVYPLAETLLHHVEAVPLRILRVSVLGTCVVLPLAGLSMVRLMPDRLRAMAPACVLQCAVGWTLIVWWFPSDFGKWWMLTLPALIGGCACALEGLIHRIRSSLRPSRLPWIRLWEAMPLLLGACYLAFDAGALLHQRHPNVPFEQSLRLWVAHSGPEDVLIVNGELQAHLLYWGERANTVDLYWTLHESKDAADRFADLRAMIEQAVQHHHVVLSVHTLNDDYSNEQLRVLGLTSQEMRHFFDQYPWQDPLFSYQTRANGPSQQVYRLALPHTEQ